MYFLLNSHKEEIISLKQCLQTNVAAPEVLAS